MAIDTIFAHGSMKSRPSPRAIAYRVWRDIRAWLVKRHTRRALLDMTDDQLRDIGIARSEARRETEKSFYWD